MHGVLVKTRSGFRSGGESALAERGRAAPPQKVKPPYGVPFIEADPWVESTGQSARTDPGTNLGHVVLDAQLFADLQQVGLHRLGVEVARN